MRSFFHFFWAAIKSPLQVSTLFETGPSAIQSLIAAIPARPAGMVVELGVGTGAITQTLFNKIGNADKYIGLELNDELIEFAQERFPALRFVNDSAENFAKYLDGAKAAAVVSSLPWTLMPAEAVKQTLDAAKANLIPGGVFATYMTLHVLKTPAGKRFQEALKERFGGYESKLVIDNLPPAKIFIARK
jgi:phosphatidylethanolamine/phosphatidyl-N-methylethanolamine N-methyltransferase